MSNIPEPWHTAMVEARMVDPRYTDDRPSLSRLAEVAGIHTTTVSRMVKGTAATKPEHVEAVAEALRVDVRTVSKWVNQARTEVAPYKVPEEVNLLTKRQQDALTELIRSMAVEREGGEHVKSSAPIATSQAGGADQRPPDPGELAPDLVDGDAVDITPHDQPTQAPDRTRRQARSHGPQP